MWQEDDIGLIGRDRLLENELLPRVRGTKAPCVLVGSSAGVGVSACLEWIYLHAPEPKAMVSADWTRKEICIEIAHAWQLRIERAGKVIRPEDATLVLLEHAINRAPPGILVIDDLHLAPPKILTHYLKPWREKFHIFCGGTPPFKHELLKRVLWGLKEIKIEPLDERSRKRLAELMCRHEGSAAAPSEIAQNSRGLPGRILGMARGTVENESPGVRGEEIIFAPALFVLVGAFVAVRYLGVSLANPSIYLLSGFGMMLAVLLRHFIYRGMKE